MPDYPLSVVGTATVPDPQPATATAIGALLARVDALEARVAALEAGGAPVPGPTPTPPSSGDATFGTLTVTNKLKLRTTKADPYTEIQWLDEAGLVIAQIVAHLDVHSGRSVPDGGHLSFYIRDLSDSDKRRGAIDMDTGTAQNSYKPAIRYENMSPYLRDGSAIYEQFTDGDFRLEKRADGTAVWTKASAPKYP